MKRLEIIHVRLAVGYPEDLIGDIQRTAAEQNQKCDLKVYLHAELPTDLAIHILHESSHTEELASSLGLQLASEMKEHGMVEHSVWIEPGT